MNMWFVQYCTNGAQNIPYESGPYNTREEALEFANSLSEISRLLGIVIEDYKNETYEILE
jgi:hypothetical protein